jgi:hypothetical protein
MRGVRQCRWHLGEMYTDVDSLNDWQALRHACEWLNDGFVREAGR